MLNNKVQFQKLPFWSNIDDKKNLSSILTQFYVITPNILYKNKISVQKQVCKDKDHNM
jgi:hypothetical protein